MALRWLATLALLPAACVVEPVDFSAKRCPCDDGFTCDTVLDICIEGDVMPEEGLVLYWRFDDDPRDGQSEDATSNGHTGSCTAGRCPTPTTGRVGGAYELDGHEQHVDAIDDGDFATTSAFTVAVWARPATLTRGASVAKTRDAPAGAVSWSIGIDAAARAVAAIYDGARETRVESDIDVVGVAEWTHLALVFDDGEATLYAGGVMVARAASGIAFDAGALEAGGDGAGPSRLPWSGALDDVRLYDRALSPGDVEALATP